MDAEPSANGQSDVDTSVGEVEARSHYDKRSDDDNPKPSDLQSDFYKHLLIYIGRYRRDASSILRVTHMLRLDLLNGRVDFPVGELERVAFESANRTLERSVAGTLHDIFRRKQRVSTSLPA
jgi:hypothetical protein